MLLDVFMLVMQELCGVRSNRPDSLICMIKTRQWQDAMDVNKQDDKPWKAYYRLLGQLDLQRVAAKEDPGFQQKFNEWLDDCLQHKLLGLHAAGVWKMLDGIRNHGPYHESGLREWQDSFLDQPLQIQWESQGNAAGDVPPVLPSLSNDDQGPPTNTQPLYSMDTEAAAAMPAMLHNWQLAAGCALPDDDEIMGPHDFEGLGDVFLAVAATPQEVQPYAEQMQTVTTANNQPNTEPAMTSQVPAEQQVEAADAVGQGSGVDDKLHHPYLLFRTADSSVTCTHLKPFV